MSEKPPAPRALIAAFAERMEAKLATNDHKPPWRDEALLVHLNHLRDEVDELLVAIIAHRVDGDPLEEVALEAADVALLAMMVWDWVCKPMPHDGRGREVVEDDDDMMPCGCSRDIRHAMVCGGIKAQADPFVPFTGPWCTCACHREVEGSRNDRPS